MEQKVQQQPIDSDEINLLEYIYVLVKNKWVIIGLTILGFIGGYIIAMIKGPVYIADAVIAPRESESVKTPDLSGLGMFGGMVASQLNIGGNASLDKIDMILDSRKFNEEVVQEKNLIPLMYPEMWDSVNNKWAGEGEIPRAISVGAYIKAKFLKKEMNKNGTMSIQIEHQDSLVAHDILTAYLTYLDSFIRKNVQEEAKENRDYLEKQLVNVTDPLLRAKFQELIAKEVEKMMVVSKEAFRVVDDVFTYKSFREKKLYPILFSGGVCLVAIVMVVLVYAFSSSSKSPEDEVLLQNIKREVIKPPFRT
jgi:LPS O-antigen subunit length determinant protein (WzzB/FepE family)